MLCLEFEDCGINDWQSYDTMNQFISATLFWGHIREVLTINTWPIISVLEDGLEDGLEE